MSKMRLLSLSATILWLLLGINGCGGADDTSASPAEGVGGTQQATGGSGSTDNVGGDDGGGEDGVVYAVLGPDGRYHCDPPMQVGPEKDRPPRCQTSTSVEADASPPPDATDEPADALPPAPDATACRDWTDQTCERTEENGGPCMIVQHDVNNPCVWDCRTPPDGAHLMMSDMDDHSIPIVCPNLADPPAAH